MRSPAVVKGKFDDLCLTHLSDLFNENKKWVQVANALDYQIHIEAWEKTRNPTKMMFVFSEVSYSELYYYLLIDQ